MSCRHATQVLSSDAAGIAAAAEILRAGGLVAFPTETVYGLGADALNPVAVRGIFEAKRRPADDPLIVHLAHAAHIETVAIADETAWQLAECFMPGPLTVVLPKQPEVPLEVTAGLSTVGVRVPSHALAHALLEAAKLPIAAPSANLFGRPSPTTAQHVLDDLAGRIDAVLDGGPSSIGVESTIIDLSSSVPRLLRPGGLPVEAIEAVLGVPLPAASATSTAQLAPGMLPSHYAPRTRLVLVPGGSNELAHEVERAVEQGRRVGVMTLEEDAGNLPHGLAVEVVGTWSDPIGTAARLFRAMRRLDAANLDVIFTRELADPSLGLGKAIADRLKRASRRAPGQSAD